MRTLLAMVLALSLAGCFAPVVEGGRQTADYAKRGSLEPKAAAGDAQAQYELGNSYCCTVAGQAAATVSVYDNDKATHWLCQSARQSYGPAQYKLARIYSGDLIDGVRLIKRGAALLRTQKTDPAVALMWARLAAGNNVKGAADLASDLQDEASTADKERAGRLALDWSKAPCEWSDVFAAK